MTALPPREYLDEAAKAAGLSGWAIVEQLRGIPTSGIIAHARTLEEKASLEARLAKYEPPVDPITAEVRACLKAHFHHSDDAIDDGDFDNTEAAKILRVRISREREHPLI